VIKLTVQNYNGSPLPQPLSAYFDELGGTIGRADNNQLVLPDPERSISRVHAQVLYRHGGYAVVDRGSNPVQHNGHPLGNGQEAPLQPGDQLVIGGYLIQVDQVTAMGSGAEARLSTDPFADLGGMAFAAPANSSPRAPAPSAPGQGGGMAAGGSSAASLDPLAGFGFGGHAAPPATGPMGASPAVAAPMRGGIPDDWNPFAPDLATPSTQDLARNLGGSGNLGSGGATSPSPLIPDMGDLGGGKANTSSSLDAMFGLGGLSGGDPLANSVLAQADRGPNMASHVDPMKSLGSVSPVTAAAVPDQVSELNQPFLAAPLAAPKATPPAPVLSWDEGAQEGRTVIRPKSASAQPKPVTGDPVLSAPPVPAPAPMFSASSTPAAPTGGTAGPVPASAGAMPMPVAADQAVLLAALASGLGMPTLPVQRLTPEFMHLLGQLVHEATRGTVDLLVARAALKREVRAEVTMIVAKENNPLKFSPSAEVALNHLLSPPVKGFMPAAPAMRDAYDDLRAHQFAFVAGMRAALEGVLKRFDPAELEGKLTQRSTLSSLLPGSRKARMWEMFIELYGQISSEASDDFHDLFGKEFLRAYESYIDQLQRDE
jgi:FHA domain-containing protein